MLKRLIVIMDSKITMFSILVISAIFAMGLPMDSAFAQPSVDGEGEYKDGEHEGKSCPSKEKKTASFDIGLNL